MLGIINSLNGLLIASIICFFAFALQGFQQGALIVGIASLLTMGLKALIVSVSVKERATAFFAPSHSNRIRNRRLRLRAQ